MGNEQVITLTNAAVLHIKKNIKQGETAGFRLSVNTSGCNGLTYVPEIVEQPGENDIQYKIDDVWVYVDPDCVQYIKGTTIDFVDKGLGQTQIAFHNPNVDGTCGCGESFNVDDV